MKIEFVKRLIEDVCMKMEYVMDAENLLSMIKIQDLVDSEDVKSIKEKNVLDVLILLRNKMVIVSFLTANLMALMIGVKIV